MHNVCASVSVCVQGSSEPHRRSSLSSLLHMRAHPPQSNVNPSAAPSLSHSLNQQSIYRTSAESVRVCAHASQRHTHSRIDTIMTNDPKISRDGKDNGRSRQIITAAFHRLKLRPRLRSDLLGKGLTNFSVEREPHTWLILSS